jgi:hypothetical protein
MKQPNHRTMSSSAALEGSMMMNAMGMTIAPTSSCMVRRNEEVQTPVDHTWRQAPDLRRLRSRNVVLVERMLKGHQPHEVLTEVSENSNWRSKTFMLALKIERLIFLASTSRENYLNEQTLKSRIHILAKHLIRIRKRKNAPTNLLSPGV